MNKIICWITLFTLGLYINFSCKEHLTTAPTRFTEDLFASGDTSLFHHAIKKIDKNSDSAFEQSDLVAVCKIINIDSNVHQNEKAPFYLIAASVDTLLKGNISLNKKLYFISYQCPTFNDKAAKWIVYLSKIKNANLFEQNYIEWQYLLNAPFIKYIL